MEDERKANGMKNWKRILLIALAVFAVLYAAVTVYLGTYYRADMDAVYALGGASIFRDDQIGQTVQMIADFIK